MAGEFAFGGVDDGRRVDGVIGGVPKLPRGRRYVAVAAGAEHTVLLRDDGAAVAFGDDRLGQQERGPSRFDPDGA